jgi:pimeloyl-ACP methyl ester carboxylesterase
MSKHLALAMALAAGLQGCVFRDVKEQQAKIAAYCTLEGEIAAERRAPQAPLVLLLLRQVAGDAAGRDAWRLHDHFVLEAAGPWQFRVSAGTYRFAAFQDLDRDLQYRPGEPFLRADPGPSVACRAGEPHRHIALHIPAAGAPRTAETIDIAGLQARGIHEQLQRSLGEATAVGALATLTDARFADAVAEDGLWRPFDFVFKAGPGVYFLERYDPRKLPVLFVHGINGTPANFRTLVGRLDRDRVQPWLYYYPSGAALDGVADHLTQTMRKVLVTSGATRFAVVAHSMGGLVSRGFLLRYAESDGAAAMPLLVTIATPWGGHKGAELGVKTAPAVVRVWVDMAPGSAYQRALYYKDPETQRVPRSLPPGMPHHLLFTFKQGSMSFGEANDGTVTVASHLRREAQRDAARLYGFDETHMGVLESKEVSSLLNDLLASARQAP